MSNKSIIIFLLILIVVMLIALFAIYFIKNNTPENVTVNVLNTSQKNTITDEKDLEEDEEKEDTENTIENETTNNLIKVDLSKNTTTNSTSTSTTVSSSEPDIDELKKFMNTYSVGIQRISNKTENLESNTILLYLAKQFFNSTSVKNTSLEVDTTYASTVQNIHTYLSELTENDYTNTEYIRSFKNYIAYSSGTNSYVYGKDISILRKEKYECTQLVLTDEDNGTYTAKGQVTRQLDDVTTSYDITLTFKINKNYKYQKYKILSLKTANKSFYPDNTVHLVEVSE